MSMFSTPPTPALAPVSRPLVAPVRTPSGAPPAAAARAPQPGASPFRRAVEAAPAPRPLRTVTLPLSAWAPTFPDKPAGDIQIGLRLYSEADATQARAAAAQKAVQLHPDPSDMEGRLEAYNGTLMAILVARGVCVVDDAHQPYFKGAEDGVMVALTPKGVEFLFWHLDDALTEESPLAPEAGAGDLAWLAGVLADGGVWNTMAAAEVRRTRRVLARAIEMMRGDEG